MDKSKPETILETPLEIVQVTLSGRATTVRRIPQRNSLWKGTTEKITAVNQSSTKILTCSKLESVLAPVLAPNLVLALVLGLYPNLVTFLVFSLESNLVVTS